MAKRLHNLYNSIPEVHVQKTFDHIGFSYWAVSPQPTPNAAFPFLHINDNLSDIDEGKDTVFLWHSIAG